MVTVLCVVGLVLLMLALVALAAWNVQQFGFVLGTMLNVHLGDCLAALLTALVKVVSGGE